MPEIHIIIAVLLHPGMVHLRHTFSEHGHPVGHFPTTFAAHSVLKGRRRTAGCRSPPKKWWKPCHLWPTRWSHWWVSKEKISHEDKLARMVTLWWRNSLFEIDDANQFVSYKKMKWLSAYMKGDYETRGLVLLCLPPKLRTGTACRIFGVSWWLYKVSPKLFNKNIYTCTFSKTY